MKRPDRIKVASEYFLANSNVDIESGICHVSTAVYEGSEDVLFEVEGVLGIYLPRWQLERALAMMSGAEGADLRASGEARKAGIQTGCP